MLWAGQTVIGETCPQYLLLDESRYQGGSDDAAASVMSPPLRAKEHQTVLWEALALGAIQTLATDHCPFTMAEKKKFAGADFTMIPNGCGGIEHRMPLLYSFGVKRGKISLAKFVIRVGSDADLVIWDPEIKSTISAARQWQRCDHTVYQGLELQGAPRLVFSRGQAVFENGKIQADPDRGNYLVRDWGRSSNGRSG
jgi:dihydropyrimidinase